MGDRPGADAELELDLPQRPEEGEETTLVDPADREDERVPVPQVVRHMALNDDAPRGCTRSRTHSRSSIDVSTASCSSDPQSRVS